MAKLPKNRVYTTPQVEYMLRKQLSTALHNAVNDYSAVLALCLMDKLGFKHKRCKRFLSEVGTRFDDIQKGLLNVEDVKQTLAEEVKVFIQ